MKRLRQIIREAPLVDIMPTGVHDPYEGGEYDDDDPDPRLAGGEYSHDELEDNKKSIKKYFNTKKFRDSAIRHYANLPVDIYLVPLYTTEPTGEGRTSTTRLNDPNDVSGVDNVLSQAQLSAAKIMLRFFWLSHSVYIGMHLLLPSTTMLCSLPIVCWVPSVYLIIMSMSSFLNPSKSFSFELSQLLP